MICLEQWLSRVDVNLLACLYSRQVVVALPNIVYASRYLMVRCCNVSNAHVEPADFYIKRAAFTGSTPMAVSYAVGTMRHITVKFPVSLIMSMLVTRVIFCRTKR